MTRYSKVFVPVSVDKRMPPYIKKYFTLWDKTKITEMDVIPFNATEASRDIFKANATHWLEEKENVYVLTEQELKDLLLELSKKMDTYYGFVLMPDRIYEPRIEQFLQSKTNP